MQQNLLKLPHIEVSLGKAGVITIKPVIRASSGQQQSSSAHSQLCRCMSFQRYETLGEQWEDALLIHEPGGLGNVIIAQHYRDFGFVINTKRLLHKVVLHVEVDGLSFAHVYPTGEVIPGGVVLMPPTENAPGEVLVGGYLQQAQDDNQALQYERDGSWKMDFAAWNWKYEGEGTVSKMGDEIKQQVADKLNVIKITAYDASRGIQVPCYIAPNLQGGHQFDPVLTAKTPQRRGYSNLESYETPATFKTLEPRRSHLQDEEMTSLGISDHAEVDYGDTITVTMPVDPYARVGKLLGEVLIQYNFPTMLAPHVQQFIGFQPALNHGQATISVRDGGVGNNTDATGLYNDALNQPPTGVTEFQPFEPYYTGEKILPEVEVELDLPPTAGISELLQQLNDAGVDLSKLPIDDDEDKFPPATISALTQQRLNPKGTLSINDDPDEDKTDDQEDGPAFLGIA